MLRGDVEPTQPPNIDDDLCSFLDQLDGNISLTSTTSSFVPDCDIAENHIPVHTSHRLNNDKYIYCPRLPPVLKTIRRSNKVLQAVTIPKISNYNMRSLMPKIQSFGTDM